MLYLTYGAYHSWKNFEPTLPAPETRIQQSVFKAAMVNILNPGPYIFWSLVTGPILLSGWRETPIYGVGFLISFYTAMILSLT